jgi:hypothetical protein
VSDCPSSSGNGKQGILDLRRGTVCNLIEFEMREVWHLVGRNPSYTNSLAVWREAISLLDPTLKSSNFLCHPRMRIQNEPGVQRQILQLVEQAADSPPEVHRVVFITQVIEGTGVNMWGQLLQGRKML